MKSPSSAPLKDGVRVRITTAMTFHELEYLDRVGTVVKAFPYEGGCGYHVRVIEGRAPVPVWRHEIEIVATDAEVSA